MFIQRERKSYGVINVLRCAIKKAFDDMAGYFTGFKNDYELRMTIVIRNS